MPMDYQVSTAPLVFDPYAVFQTEYQENLLNLFKNGATLFLWRGTCPYNYYVETADGKTNLIVAGDRESCENFGTGSAQLEALHRLARPAFASSRLISGGSRLENGRPEQEGWSFDADVARQLEQRWAAFQAERVIRDANVKAPAPQLDKLSELALALLRKLKTLDISVVSHEANVGLGRYPELASAYAELDDQGLLQVTNTGKFCLVPAAAKLRVPRGPMLRLVWVRR